LIQVRRPPDHMPKLAQYLQLIEKAVAGLNAQDRRVLYDRGKNALIAELRAIRPHISESVIMKERMAFEDASRRVEAEIARRAPNSEWPA
jgi:hypothetical protein